MRILIALSVVAAVLSQTTLPTACNYNLAMCRDKSGSLTDDDMVAQTAFLSDAYLSASALVFPDDSTLGINAFMATFATNTDLDFDFGPMRTRQETAALIQNSNMTVERDFPLLFTRVTTCMDLVSEQPIIAAETNVLMVVTDGIFGDASGNGDNGDTDEEVMIARDRLLDNGWTIYAVGFGGNLLDGLLLATDDQSDRVFEANDADGLATQIDAITGEICDQATGGTGGGADTKIELPIF